MKIALVHEHLAQDGGAERTLKVLAEIFPAAPIYTLVYNPKRANPFFKDKKIITSFIQKLPWAKTKYPWYLSLMATAVEKYDLSGYDLVFSSNSAFAKGVITLSSCLHICYCHSPTRYLWSDTIRYVEELPYARIFRKLIPFYLTKLRLWDRLAADRPDLMIANSANVQTRITKYYRRKSDIIYPPVETSHFQVSTEAGNYFLIGGRLVSYKRYDLAVAAFNKLGIPLKIFGEGPELKYLQKIAKPNIEFLGKVSDGERASLFSHCQAFIHPQEEDFGLTALETMASGRPVIALAVGGALETVVANETGVFFEEPSWEALADAVIRFKKQEFDPQKIRNHALKFGVDQFKIKMKKYVEENYQKFKNNH